MGAAAGPLIGGVTTTGITWRAAFIFQAVVIGIIVLLSRRIEDPVAPDPTKPFDTVGTVLSAVGLVLLVTGILQAENHLVITAALLAAGALVLAWFFHHTGSARGHRHRARRAPQGDFVLTRYRSGTPAVALRDGSINLL